MLPLEPDPVLEPDPLVLEPAPVLGVGDAVLEPVAPVPALEPDLLKWASHSEREIWPSLFVSTDEKLGAAELEALPEPDMPLELGLELGLAAGLELELEPPDAALPPEDDVGLSLLVLLDEELCASATLESANSAAAVAALRTLSFNIG